MRKQQCAMDLGRELLRVNCAKRTSRRQVACDERYTNATGNMLTDIGGTVGPCPWSAFWSPCNEC